MRSKYNISRFICVGDEIWQVNTGQKSKHPINVNQMKGIIRQLELMILNYNKVFVLVFDLKLSHYTEDNKIISKFNARLFRYLRTKYQMKHIGYSWARETHNQPHQHYHYALMLNGSKIRKGYSLFDDIDEFWSEVGGASWWNPENSEYLVRRGDSQQLQNVIYRLSYQAKQRGKGKAPTQTKDYGMSRLKS